MTRSMIPGRNLLRRHCDTYGGAFCLDGGGGVNDNEETAHFDVIKKLSSLSSITTTSSMADRTVGQTPGGGGDEEEEEEGGVSSGSKSWLQLGLTTSSSTALTAPVGRREPPLELNLFVDRPQQQQEPARPPGAVNTNPPFLAVIPSIQSSSMQMAFPVGMWNPNILIGGSNPMLISPPVDRPVMPEFMARQNAYQSARSYGSTSAPVGGVGGMRAINPPLRRPQTGIWFSLQAAQAQGRDQASLPQISKSYLRIKDGRMTVRLLMKYLASKLGFEDETQVEMTCRGQVLDPSLTLQHVRDSIWCLRDAAASAAVTLFPDSSTTHHIMTLHYCRRFSA